MELFIQIFVLTLWICAARSQAPVITVESLVSAIKEQATDEVTIADLDCAAGTGSTTPVKDMVISLNTVGPSNAPCVPNCFQVFPNCGTTYCLKFMPLATLNYAATREYRLTIRCEDTITDATTDLEIEIRIEPNLPPFFTNGNAATDTVTNTESLTTGSEVSSKSDCTDPELDAITYTLTPDRQTNLFSIDSSGSIRATGNLKSACWNAIKFRVTCQDGFHSTLTPAFQDIQITLNGANDMPMVTSLNYSLNLPEDAAVGFTVASFTVTDDDTTDIDCRLSATPTDALQYYELSATERDILVKDTLDYEQAATRRPKLVVLCSDGFCTSHEAFLDVTVTDVNEPITINPQDFTLTTYEGDISLNPNWSPIDEDLDDSITYTIVGGNPNGNFAIDPTSGLITSIAEYDVDEGAMPTTDFIVVQVEDEADHTSTTTVSLSILDSNDNRPIFPTTTTTFYRTTDCDSTIGSILGSVSASDRDSSFQGNNVITYGGSGGPITVSANGNIQVGTGITPGTYTIEARATDAGEHPGVLVSSPTVTITVSVTTCPTTTTPAPTTTAAPTTAAPTTTTAGPVTISPNSSENLDENLGWIIIAGLLATVLLAALIFMLWRFCFTGAGSFRLSAFCNNACQDCCAPRPPPREVRVPRGNPPKGGNKGFWQEYYSDADYKEQPIRDRVPSPVRMEGGGPLHTDNPLNSWRRPQPLDY